MKKVILLTVLLVIGVSVIAIYLWQTPTEEKIEVDEENTWVYSALVNLGIEDAVVDITPERALIRYNLPENMSKEAVQYYIMGAAATVAPNSSKIIIQVYGNFEPLEEVVVATKDVLAFMNGSIAFDEFKERIKIKPLK